MFNLSFSQCNGHVEILSLSYRYPQEFGFNGSVSSSQKGPFSRGNSYGRQESVYPTLRNGQGSFSYLNYPVVNPGNYYYKERHPLDSPSKSMFQSNFESMSQRIPMSDKIRRKYQRLLGSIQFM